MKRRALCQLLSPLSTENFFRDNWQLRAVHVSGVVDKWKRLDALAGFDWLPYASELSAAGRDQHGQQHQATIDETQVAGSYRSGMTICADVSAHPQLVPWLQQLGIDFMLAGGRPFAKMYASPDGSGFAPHFDMFHVFVLQLSGRKRWRFSPEPALPSPLCSAKLDADGTPVWAYPREGQPIDDDGNPLAPPLLDSFDEVVLQPGDLLYLPPGAWHVAEAIDHSLAVSISPQRTPVAQLLLKAIEEQLLTLPAFRADLFSAAPLATAGTVPDAIARTFSERLHDLAVLLQDFDPRVAHRLWRINLAADEPPLSPRSPPGALSLLDETELEHGSTKLQQYLLAPDDEGTQALFFYGAGEEWSLPIEALRFIRVLVEHPQFRMGESYGWDPLLTAKDVRAIVTQLLEVDLLRYRAA